MATFIDLDSNWRDREIYPNPANYELTPSQVEGWFRNARSVRAFPQNPSTQPLNFVVSMNIHYLTVPYSDPVAALPRVYVDFHSRKYNDIHLIQAIDGRHQESRWICNFDRIQRDPVTDDPLWIHFRCTMEQVMRFKKDDTMVFRVTTRDGSTLPNLDNLVPDPPDPLKQILCTFDCTPYLRDGDYSESALVQPTNVS